MRGQACVGYGGPIFPEPAHTAENVKRLSWILTFPLVVVIVVFAIANREMVTFDLWPFELSVSAPLFVAILGSLFTGLLIGGLTAWLSAGKARWRARVAGRRTAELEREIARLNREREPAMAPRQSAGTPGLPAVSGAHKEAGERGKQTVAGS